MNKAIYRILGGFKSGAAALVVLSTVGLPSAAHAATGVYPDYPSQIAQSSDFSVTIMQAGQPNRTAKIWDPTRTTGSHVTGDDWRRFCEFYADNVSAATPVTVQIKVTTAWNAGFSYKVIQNGSGWQAPTEFLDGADGKHTITVTLTSLRKFVVRINNDDNKTLAVFPDAPETGAPTGGSATVIYIGTGTNGTPSNFYSPVSDGTSPLYSNAGNELVVTAGQTLYIKPGAVLNARVRVTGSNVTIKGRGLIRDGIFDKAHVDKTMIRVGGGLTNVNIQDVKLVDSEHYNLYVHNTTNGATISNVKIMSNRVNSDGITFTGNVQNVTVNDCFLHIADNVLLVGATGGLTAPTNCTFSNNLLGSTASTIFLQGNLGTGMNFTGNTVFRNNPPAGDDRIALVSSHFGGAATWNQVLIQGLNAQGSVKVNRLFYTNSLGNQTKTITLRNVYTPNPTAQAGGPSGSQPTHDNAVVVDNNAPDTYPTGGVQLTLDNIWYDNSMVVNATATEADAVNYSTGVTPTNTFGFAATNIILSNAGFAGNTTGWGGAWGPGATISAVAYPANPPPPTPPNRGTHFAQVTWTTSRTAGIMQDVRQKLIDNGPGYYHADVWVKTGTGTLPVNLRLAIDGAYPLTAGTVTATTTWQKISIEGYIGTTPSSWAALAIDATGSNITYYVDEASLVKKPNAP